MEKFLKVASPIADGTSTASPAPVGNNGGTTPAFGTITSVVALEINNTAAKFATSVVVLAGDIAYNVTTGVWTTVTVVDSDIKLTLADDIFKTALDKYRVMPSADAFLLVDSGTAFLDDVAIGDIVMNGLGRKATVVSVNSDTDLTLSAPIMAVYTGSLNQDDWYIWRTDSDGSLNSQLLSITDVAGVSYTSASAALITYKERTSGGALRTASVAVLSEGLDLNIDLQNAVTSSYSENWTRVVRPLVTSLDITGITFT